MYQGDLWKLNNDLLWDVIKLLSISMTFCKLFRIRFHQMSFKPVSVSIFNICKSCFKSSKTIRKITNVRSFNNMKEAMIGKLNNNDHKIDPCGTPLIM